MVDRTFNYYKLVFHSMNPMSCKNDVQKCDAWLSEMVYTTEWWLQLFTLPETTSHRT